MKKRLLTIVAGLTTAYFAAAQDSTTVAAPVEETSSELSISGSIDTYYRTVIGAQKNQAPASSFANGNQFSIGMANVILAKEGEKTGFVADLVFGPRGNDAVFNSTTGTSPAVNQLYAYWNVSDKVTLTLGNFNTFLGYEVISPTGNFNYSTSYMFSYGPFSHTGLKADIALTDELSLMVGALNQTDATETNPINNLHFGTQLGYSNDMGGAWLNFLAGNPAGEDGSGATNYEIDLTTGWDVSDQLYLGLNAAYYNMAAKLEIEGVEDPSAGFYGAALYAQYAVSDIFSLGLRGEYFSEYADYTEPMGIIGIYNANDEGTSIDGSVIDLTLSGNISLGDLTLIPEFRVDMVSDNDAEEKLWLGGEEGTNVLPSFLLAAVYSF